MLDSASMKFLMTAHYSNYSDQAVYLWLPQN